jgi:hypothetical protein
MMMDMDMKKIESMSNNVITAEKYSPSLLLSFTVMKLKKLNA